MLKKKLLLYIDSMQPAGGIERVVSNLANEWIKSYDVTILVKDEINSFYKLSNDIDFVSLNSKLNISMKSNKFIRGIKFIKSILLSRRKLKKIINNIQPDYIYTTNPINSLEIVLIGKKYYKRLVISEHGSKFGYNKIYKKLKKIVYKRCYVLSVPTKMDTIEYRKEKYNAIYIPHISTFRSSKKTNYSNKRVLNIGRLTNDKNQLALLKIWNNIIKEDIISDWELLIIGKGENKKLLIDYIVNNNLSETVKIINPISNIQDIYINSDIFAFTSKYEGFGMVLLEAMSFGIPCISYDCPSGPRDIIKNNINGFLIENENFESYKNNLIDLMTKPNLMKQMGENAFNQSNNWNNNKILEEWDKVFK